MDTHALLFVHRPSIAAMAARLIAEEEDPSACSVVVVVLRRNPVGLQLILALEADDDMVADVSDHEDTAIYFNTARNEDLALLLGRFDLAYAAADGRIRVLASTEAGISTFEVPRPMSIAA